MKRLFSKKIGVKIVAALLVAAFMVPASFVAFTIQPKKAEAGIGSCLSGFLSAFGLSMLDKAIFAPIAIPVNPLGSTAHEATTGGNSNSTFIRDCIEHGLALAIGKFLLTKMTDSIVEWINGGFDGNPTFVSNPKKFFGDVADQIAGEVILASRLAFLCSPFKLQVQIALALDYQTSSSQRSKCTLSQVVGNVDTAFTDFTQGGWGQWLSITQNSQNNPYGSYLEASADMGARIQGAKDLQLFQLDWNGGFLSWQTCRGLKKDANGQAALDANGQPITEQTVMYGGSGSVGVAGQTAGINTPPEGQNCITNTPGRVIGDSLQNSLNVPANQLGLADDLDKIFNALVDQLLKNVLGGTGLLGLSQPSANNGPSPLDLLMADALQNQANATTDANGSTGQLNGAGNAGGGTPGSGGFSGKPTSPTQNLALNALVSASSIASPMTAITDGNRTNILQGQYEGARTNAEGNPWIEIELGVQTQIDNIVIHQRTNPDSGSRQINFRVQVLDENKQVVWTSSQQTQNFGNPIKINVPELGSQNVTGKYVKIIRNPDGSAGANARLEIAEVEVYPHIAPTITFNGSPSMTIGVGQPFNDPGVRAVDQNGTDITAQVQRTSNVNTAQTGTYTVTYTVIDNKGASATLSRTVTVQEGYRTP